MEDILGRAKQAEAEWRMSVRKKAAELAGQTFHPEFEVTRAQCVVANQIAYANGGESGLAYMLTAHGNILVTAAMTAAWYSETDRLGLNGKYIVRDYTTPPVPKDATGECDAGHEVFLGGKKDFYISRCTTPGCKSFVRAGTALTSKQVATPKQTEEIPF